MSELAHRRYMKAPTVKDADPKDALESALWEMKQEEEPTQHVIVIRAHMSDDGLNYQISQAGKFNIAERMGLMAVASTKITAD